MSACEFVADATARIILAARALGISDDIARMLASEWEQGITRDWRGERPYIGARAGLAQSARDAAIVRDWKNGERVPLLMRRYGISRSRVWAILKAAGVSRAASCALP